MVELELVFQRSEGSMTRAHFKISAGFIATLVVMCARWL